jgi:two-component system, OmpR family, sensor histidine kinase BaeS
MNRLVTLLTIAMLSLAFVSASIVMVSQQLDRTLEFQRLPLEIQNQILAERASRTPPPDEPTGKIFDVLRKYFGIMPRSVGAVAIGLGIAGIVALILSIFLARLIARPIEQVIAASSHVAKGELNVRVEEPRSPLQSETRQLARNFNVMAAALESYEKERRDMIASIAHDLRTPLTAIQVRLEVLQEGLAPFSQEEITLLLTQTELLNRLIEDLRTLTLADAGKLSLKKQTVDLAEFLHTIIDTYKERARARGVTLTLKSEQSLSVTVDPERITQIVSNLLDNALRISPRGGEVSVQLSKNIREIRFSVSDEGPGIPEKLLPAIFERYVQDKDTGGSSGLGLAIVKTLVTLHGGTVTAENTLGGGASFNITLPADVQEVLVSSDKTRRRAS